MHNAPSQLDPELQKAIERGYESRDVNLGILIKWVVGLFAFAGAASVISMGIYLFLAPRSVTETAWPRPADRRVPDGPVVQSTPLRDIADYRAQENSTVHGYGKDAKTGAGHVPVDRAMELYLEKGAPTKLDTKPVTVPGGAPTGQAPEATHSAPGEH